MKELLREREGKFVRIEGFWKTKIYAATDLRKIDRERIQCSGEYSV